MADPVVQGKYTLMAEELKEMTGAHTFSDFKICIKGESLPCHRLVLSVHSAMMKEMLTSNTAEAANQSVTFDHLDLEAMKIILDYMYVGEVSFHTKQLGDIIIACDYLRINRLPKICASRVPSIIHPSNAILWLKLSHNLDLADVKSHCLEIIGASFNTISKQPGFVDLSLINVQECLDHGQATGYEHDAVLDAALKWVDHDSTERLDHLNTLMDQIQLDLCSLDGIIDVMDTHKTMVNTNRKTLYGRLITALSVIVSSEAKPPSKPRLAIIGGQTPNKEVSRAWWKLNEDMEAEEMRRIPFHLQCYHSVCKTPGGFIISGGFSVLCLMYNAPSNTWSVLENMITRRTAHGSVSIRGVLYALGGYIDGNPSKTVHSLVIDEGRWQVESDLPNSLILPQVVELNERVYLLDQENGQLFQMDDQKEWSAKAPLPRMNYHGTSMTSVNDKLYVAGIRVFAWYIPATDTWVQGQQPRKIHNYGSLIYYNTKLLLLGGSHGSGTDEVEEFDLEDETWSVCRWKMPAPLYTHHAVVLDIPEEV